MSTDVAVYDDDVFGTTVMVGIGFNIQSESSSPFQPQIRSVRRGPQRHITNGAADRVAEPVYRLPNIAVRQGEYRATLEGVQWQILHVVEGATGGDGSFERPFGTLDQAIAVANDGYLVYTPYGGTYQPTPMFVVPEGVSLLSNAPVHYLPTDAGWLPLPLSGASPDLSAAPQILGSVTLSDRATLDGFRVVGYGDALSDAGVVRLADVSDATVANNMIWSRQEGIWIEDARNATAANNTVVQSFGSGIRIGGGTDATLIGNRVADAGGDGIEVLNSAHANIVGNQVELADGSGIALTEGNHATVSGNTIGLVGGNGIEVLQAPGVNVSDNSIRDALGDGILLADAADATVTGNAIGLAGQHGIELSDAPSATVADNRIGEAGWHGIAATDGTGAQIRDNAIGLAGWDGIQVADGADARIVANEIDGAHGNGITLNHGAGAIISNNWIGAVDADGIWVGVATNATVESNVIATAAGCGIRVRDGVQASVLNNEVQRAMQAAFDLQGTDNAVFTGNRLVSSAGDGIRVASANHLEISRNQLDWIDLNGIVVVDSPNGWITENTIAFAGRDAIQIIDGTDLLVSGNIVERAIGDGIDIRGGDFAGSLMENSITDARTGLNVVLTGAFQGVIRDNTLLENRSYGVWLEAGQFAADSLVSTNRIESSGREGIRILATGPNESTLIVMDNGLILNNLQDGDQHREFVAGLASGAGPMLVELRGNASYNLVPPGEFNYDFLNAGSSILLYVTDPDVPNLGTVGSSDGSVPPP